MGAIEDGKMKDEKCGRRRLIVRPGGGEDNRFAGRRRSSGPSFADLFLKRRQQFDATKACSLFPRFIFR